MRVEGVTYEINWRKFRRGTSFFIPCLAPKDAKRLILEDTRRLKYKVITKIVIEEGIRGIRVWRV
jgi:hypothetical protein